MSVGALTGYGRIPQPTTGNVKRKSGNGAVKSSAGENRDTIRLSGRDVVTAQEDGYIEVNGRRFFVSEEMSRKISATFERVQAYNEASAALDAVQQNAEAAKQQAKAVAEQAKAQAKAFEIYRRIASGGHVPPEDEDFLQNFSPELYMAAKIAAMMAKEHEDYDSVLEDEEEQSEADGESADAAHTVGKVEVSVSDGETPSVESVSAVSVEVSASVE